MISGKRTSARRKGLKHPRPHAPAPLQSRQGETRKKETLLNVKTLKNRATAILLAAILLVGTGVVGLTALAAQTVTI